MIDKLKLSNDVNKDLQDMSLEDKKKLMEEIDLEIKKAETEKIKQETILNQLNEEKETLIGEVKSLGITGSDTNNLIANIDKKLEELNEELNKDLAKYIDALKGE